MKNVSKLFRAYGLYNNDQFIDFTGNYEFQSSFELTGYITTVKSSLYISTVWFQSSFELTGYITMISLLISLEIMSFKALSSLRVI